MYVIMFLHLQYKANCMEQSDEDCTSPPSSPVISSNPWKLSPGGLTPTGGRHYLEESMEASYQSPPVGSPMGPVFSSVRSQGACVWVCCCGRAAAFRSLLHHVVDCCLCALLTTMCVLTAHTTCSLYSYTHSHTQELMWGVHCHGNLVS